MKKADNNQSLKSLPSKESSQVFNNITNTQWTSNECKSKGTYTFKDVVWPVQPAEHDQELTLMKKIFEAVEKVSAMSRFLAVRYDLHIPAYSADNHVIDCFHKLLFSQLSQVYPKSFISYLWVREQGQGQAQHYHYLLMLDGNYIRYPHKLNAIVQSCWEQAAGGRTWCPKNGYYFVTENDVDTYAKLMLRVSYLGKRRTKEAIGKGIKRIGSGFRKPKPSKIRKKVAVKQSVVISTSISNTKPQSMETCAEHYSGILDKYFANEPLRFLKHSHAELYHQEPWWKINTPRWPAHRKQYLFEALITGISLSGYARKYSLSPARTYANLRQVGGQSLKSIHWAWHRLRYQQSGNSLIDYINKNKLNQKTAAKQLRRKQMSAHWSRHFDNYYQNYWPEGWTVADYCRKEGLVHSTTRHYLVDFPFIGLINPFVLKPWL
ncbi:YagK/YfjJ domain-containing protein [Buttiauxella noackiae]|uniref:YagK/YfjJ domain-containing protein n=1 Tax=Buttiauxella noackiae TaxID=82992 RepID=UPI0006908199|nr:inovirus-type Gp2 protein [Buttiauxella noackiae]